MNTPKVKKKKKLIWFIIAGVVVITIVLFSVFNKKPKVEYTTVPLKKGTLIQTVSEVGTVKASTELDLNFNQPGQLARVLVKGGDMVQQGELLAELDYSSLVIKEQEATSNVAVARANLNKLLAGATPSQLAIYQAQVNQAQSAYQAAKDNYDKLTNPDTVDSTPLGQAVKSAELNLEHTQTSLAQARDNQLSNFLITASSKLSIASAAMDHINRILSDNDLAQVFSAKNTTYVSLTQSSYNQADTLRAPAEAAMNQAQTDTSSANLQTLLNQETTYLNAVYKATNYCFSALENSITSGNFTQISLDSYKTTISADSSYLSTGISALQAANYAYQNSILTLNNSVASAQETLNQAQVGLSDGTRQAKNGLDAANSAYQVALSQLAQIKTPPRNEDIALSQAQLAQAQSSLELAQKQISDNQIFAPINGQIGKINYGIGEQVSAAQPAMTLLTDNNFELEVDISEADIAKVKLLDAVSITLDALGDKTVLSGVVYYIEPASTVIQDVTYYKVKIKFSDPAASLTAVKAGMTANVTITTAQKDNILIAPQRGVIAKSDGSNFLRLLVNNQLQEMPVQLGLTGNDGLVEVSGPGLNENDAVVTFIKNSTTTTTN